MIGAVLPLADIAQAHTLLEGGPAREGPRRPRGKIAIAVHPQDQPHETESSSRKG